jgi:hypothetical protein
MEITSISFLINGEWLPGGDYINAARESFVWLERKEFQVQSQEA